MRLPNQNGIVKQQKPFYLNNVFNFCHHPGVGISGFGSSFSGEEFSILVSLGPKLFRWASASSTVSIGLPTVCPDKAF